MQELELRNANWHSFVNIDEHDWLVDTGAPTSFGDPNGVELDGSVFKVPSSYMGLDAAALSRLTKCSVSGLLGVDVLNNFDVLFDSPAGELSVSQTELEVEGDEIKLSECLGIPIVNARVNGSDYRMFVDTGAQLSYFQDRSLANFPRAGTVEDFLPAFGQFETESYLVDFSIGSTAATFRCGCLPGLLGMSLSLAGVDGIIGNEFICDRMVGYLPRRKRLVLAL